MAVHDHGVRVVHSTSNFGRSPYALNAGQRGRRLVEESHGLDGGWMERRDVAALERLAMLGREEWLVAGQREGR